MQHNKHMTLSTFINNVDVFGNMWIINEECMFFQCYVDDHLHYKGI
jgi:hypothetical protein